jgi:hypothetical protein
MSSRGWQHPGVSGIQISCLGFGWSSGLEVKSSAAATFLARFLGGKINNVVVYADAVTPGNPLRPDLGRAFEVSVGSTSNIGHQVVTTRRG